MFSHKNYICAGYGNIACRSYVGKGLTIIYAIIGVPLMLLFLTNIGDVFAKTFTWLYRRFVWYKSRLNLWRQRKRLVQMRQRLETQVEAFKRFQRDVSAELETALITGSEKSNEKYK